MLLSVPEVEEEKKRLGSRPIKVLANTATPFPLLLPLPPPSVPFPLSLPLPSPLP
jgi:hypothetical protein